MVNIILLCTTGISVEKVAFEMREFAEKRKLDVKITAIPDPEKRLYIPKADIILLAPQLRHTKAVVQTLAKDKLVKVMDSQDYGLLRGDQILEDALFNYGIII